VFCKTRESITCCRFLKIKAIAGCVTTTYTRSCNLDYKRLKKYDARKENTKQKNVNCTLVWAGLEVEIVMLDRSKVMRMPQVFILHVQEMSKR
jgi:hypothetical protein